MIIGRLGRDPDLRYSSGNPVATLNIATDESYVDRDGNKVERAEWHRVVVFGRVAENCRNFLAKGSLVYVEGKLQTRKWQDQQGQDKYSTDIVAQRVQFLDRKGDRPQQEDSGFAPPGERPPYQEDSGQPYKNPPRNKGGNNFGYGQQQGKPSAADYAPEGSESGMDDVPF